MPVVPLVQWIGRPTTMFCVPTHLQRLFEHWDAVGVPDLSSFRLDAHAGAPCPPSVKRRLVELFPAVSYTHLTLPTILLV